jgi:cysteine synthase A
MAGTVRLGEQGAALLFGYGAQLVLTPDSKARCRKRAEELVAEHPDWYSAAVQQSRQSGTAGRRRASSHAAAEARCVRTASARRLITGVGEVLPGRAVAGVDPQPATSRVLSGSNGYHRIQRDRCRLRAREPQRSHLRRVIAIDDAVAAEHARALARYEGLLVGIASGANCAAAIQVARKLGRGAVVLTVCCDTGERYLTTDLFRAEGI